MSGLPRTDAVVGKPRPHILALCCALERELRESTDYAAAAFRAIGKAGCDLYDALNGAKSTDEVLKLVRAAQAKLDALPEYEIVHPQPGPIVDAAGLVGANTFTFSEPVDSSGGPIGADVAARQWRENAVCLHYTRKCAQTPPCLPGACASAGSVLPDDGKEPPSLGRVEAIADHMDSLGAYTQAREIRRLGRACHSQDSPQDRGDPANGDPMTWLRKIVVDWMAGGFTSPGASGALHLAAYHFGLLDSPEEWARKTGHAQRTGNEL